MSEAATTTTFRVHVRNVRLGHGGIIVVDATSKDAAATEAIKRRVRAAKEYNAKYSAQGLPEWALHDDTAAAYTVVQVRKAPVKR